MGGSFSSSCDKERAPIASNKTAAYYHNYKPNPWSVFPEANKAAAPPSKAAANTANQFVEFHSLARWKAYFDSSKNSNKLIVIYFTATWCAPCRTMEPALKEIAARYSDVDFVKIDVDELFNVSREYGIQAMPTFLFMKKGKEVDKVVGAKKEELQRKIEKNKF